MEYRNYGLIAHPSAFSIDMNDGQTVHVRFNATAEKSVTLSLDSYSTTLESYEARAIAEKLILAANLTDAWNAVR